MDIGMINSPTPDNIISEFKGQYFFLSNYYSAPITYNGYQFLNNEAAFQAAKCPERMAEFCNLSPSKAKRLGRRVNLRDDWEDIKDVDLNTRYELIKLIDCYTKRQAGSDEWHGFDDMDHVYKVISRVRGMIGIKEDLPR